MSEAQQQCDENDAFHHLLFIITSAPPDSVTLWFNTLSRFDLVVILYAMTEEVKTETPSWAKIVDAIFLLLIIACSLQTLFILYTGDEPFRILAERAPLSPSLLLLFAVVGMRALFQWRVRHDDFLAHASILLFSGLLIVYLSNNKTLGAIDTTPTRQLPLSILKEGNFDLDEFPRLYKYGVPPYLLHINGHYVSSYPIGAAVMATPLYIPTALGPAGRGYSFARSLEKPCAAVFVSLSAVLLFWTLSIFVSKRTALVLAILYGLATSSLSVSSQALWQHGASQLAICAALLCLSKADSNPRFAGYAGFPIAMSVLCRPTDLVLFLPVAILVWLRYRKHALIFVLSGLPIAILQCAYNYYYFHQLFPNVVMAGAASRFAVTGSESWSTPLFTGLAGILASPGRGLFVYSPVFLFSFAGMLLVWIRPQQPALLRSLSVGVLFTIILYSKWMIWWGGESYGPRLLADLTPVLILFIVPVVDAIQNRLFLKAVFVLFTVWSIFAHCTGAFAADPYWNARNNVDRDPSALWRWNDNQLINPVRHLAVRELTHFGDYPTSRSMPHGLGARYSLRISPESSPAANEPIELLFEAKNTGKAVWLSGKGQGCVRLGWDISRIDPEAFLRKKVIQLNYDVFLNESYDTEISIDLPQPPGKYLMRVGLVSGDSDEYSKFGVPPASLEIEIDSNGHWRSASHMNP